MGWYRIEVDDGEGGWGRPADASLAGWLDEDKLAPAEAIARLGLPDGTRTRTKDKPQERKPPARRPRAQQPATIERGQRPIPQHVVTDPLAQFAWVHAIVSEDKREHERKLDRMHERALELERVRSAEHTALVQAVMTQRVEAATGRAGLLEAELRRLRAEHAAEVGTFREQLETLASREALDTDIETLLAQPNGEKAWESVMKLVFGFAETPLGKTLVQQMVAKLGLGGGTATPATEAPEVDLGFDDFDPGM